MTYPVWEPCVANSLLIALVAILHVFVSHFAIGGGLYLILAETIARRKNDPEHLAYIENHSKFFILVTLVFGAVTGVGIWVTIGLIHPIGTEWLIRNFVWGWASEWVFFFVEIAAALIGLPEDQVRPAVMRLAATAKEPVRTFSVSRMAGPRRTVQVEYKRASRR